MMLLVTKDLTKTYSRQQKTFEAVSHAGFSLQKGEMAVITGPSGCGKSTPVPPDLAASPTRIREVSSWKSRSW